MPSPVKREREPLTGRRRPGVDLEMAIDVLEDIADGKTLREATNGVKGRVKASTFLYWCNRVPELMEAYRMAREMSAHMFEDEALEAARKLPTLQGPAPEMSARIRGYDVMINHLRWAAGKRHPKEYGDKVQTSFTVPIQIVTNIPLEIGEGAEEAGRSGREEFVIELKPEAPGALAPPQEEGEGLYDLEPNPNRARKRKWWAEASPERREKALAGLKAGKKEVGDEEAGSVDGCSVLGVDGQQQLGQPEHLAPQSGGGEDDPSAGIRGGVPGEGDPEPYHSGEPHGGQRGGGGNLHPQSGGGAGEAPAGVGKGEPQ